MPNSPNSLSVSPVETYDFFGLGFPNEILDEMKLIHDEIERAAFGFFQQRGNNGENALDDWLRAESSLLNPVHISIKDYKDHLTVTADVPGFTIKELKVHIEGQELNICGKSEKSESPAQKGGKQERTTRRICCVVSLPEPVKSADSSAQLNNGVLTLTLPKVQPKKEIEIKAA